MRQTVCNVKRCIGTHGSKQQARVNTGDTEGDAIVPICDRLDDGTSEGAILEYNESKHLKKMENKPVESFGNDNDDITIPMKTSSDFNLDD